MSSRSWKSPLRFLRKSVSQWVVTLALLLTLFTDDSFALSCPIQFPEDMVKSYPTILVVVIERAEFFPNGTGDPYKGEVVAQFETVEVIQGDPDDARSIVIPIEYLDDSWPALVPLGYPVIVAFPKGGIAHWDSCEHQLNVNWCNPYMLRKLAGHPLEMDEKCEWSLLKLKFMKRGVETTSEAFDLEGLRKEWKHHFGEQPR